MTRSFPINSCEIIFFLDENMSDLSIDELIEMRRKRESFGVVKDRFTGYYVEFPALPGESVRDSEDRNYCSPPNTGHISSTKKRRLSKAPIQRKPMNRIPVEPFDLNHVLTLFNRMYNEIMKEVRESLKKELIRYCLGHGVFQFHSEHGLIKITQRKYRIPNPNYNMLGYQRFVHLSEKYSLCDGGNIMSERTLNLMINRGKIPNEIIQILSYRDEYDLCAI
jgi:hypothetical protein